MSNPFTQYDSEENRKQYEAEQKQKAMERRIRKSKREVMGYREAMEKAQTEESRSTFEAKYQQKAALLQKQNKAYNQYCADTGLKKQSDRITIAKWDRSQAAKATAAARKYHSSPATVPAKQEAKATTGKSKVVESPRYTDVTQEWRDNATPNSHVDGHNIVNAQQKTVENVEKSAIIENRNGKGGANVHTVGRIDIEKYRCITDDITTDEVIITPERVQHIKDRHPGDYEYYFRYIKEIIENPDYILEANKPNSALVLKHIKENTKNYKLILRLKTFVDPDE